jgi:nucleoside-diphosphate-sugar epimerase
MVDHALVVGSTGIIGSALVDKLVETGSWSVTGLARHARNRAGVDAVQVDLTDADGARRALASRNISHVFICTWSRQKTEAENCRVNGAMVRNLLDALAGGGLRYVALVTGTKHYLGPFEAFGKAGAETPFRETQPRLPVENFYYVQEDILFEAAARGRFTWSVHRPHTVIGYAVGNVMNMASTLAAYATICRETGRPFVFPGSPEQYSAVTDITDARILARHLIWAARTSAAANEAFNIVNGEVFRWRWLWRKIAGYFGLDELEFPGHPTPLVEQMKDAGSVWDRIVAEHGLVRNPIERVASWWHSDADLGRTLETFNDMGKSRRLGFLDYQGTVASFVDTFDRLRAERIIP